MGKFSAMIITAIVSCGVALINTPATACYGFRVSCETATTDWYAEPYKEIFPPKHEISCGKSYKYKIKIEANGGCEQRGIDITTWTVDHNLPQGWKKKLTDSGGMNIEGKKWFWDKLSWDNPKYIYFTITAPSNVSSGQTAKVSVRIFSQGVSPPNQESTCDVTTETIISGPPPPPQILEKVVIYPSNCSIEVGLKREFIAKGYDINNTEIPSMTFSWKLLGSIGSINPLNGEKTTFTATTVGNGTIEATGSSGGSTKTGNAQIEVKPQTTKLSKVVVVPNSVTVRVNESTNFKGEGYDQNNKMIHGLTFTWKLTAPIGAVNPQNNETTTFKATSEGTGYIQATATLGNITKTGSAFIKVKPELILDKVIVDPDSVELNIDEQHTFVATAYDNEGGTIPGLDFFWSGYIDIGEMSPVGNPNTFTATKPGHATIIVETTYKNVTKKATISAVVKSPPVPTLFADISTEYSTLYSGDITKVSIYVTNGSAPVKDCKIVLASSGGGAFNPPEGLTNGTGVFVTSFEAPPVEITTTLTISAKASKENYKDSTVDTKITVLPKLLYPDIEVFPITFSNNNPTEGDEITIKVVVGNMGKIDVKNVKIEIFVDDVPIGRGHIIQLLPKGATKEINVLWIAVKGTHTIKVIADPINSITETNERNNIQTAEITVKSVGAPSTPPGGEEGKKITPIPHLLIVGVVVVGLIVGISVAVLVSKRRRKKPLR